MILSILIEENLCTYLSSLSLSLILKIPVFFLPKKMANNKDYNSQKKNQTSESWWIQWKSKKLIKRIKSMYEKDTEKEPYTY